MNFGSVLLLFKHKITLSLLVLMSFFLVEAQIFEPVKWKFSSEHVEGKEYIIHLDATIDEGWAVYSQYLERDDGPIATSITFDEGDHFELVGKAEEDPSTKKEGYDAIFDMNLTKYFKSMKISQRIKISDFSKPVTGYLTFMTCDDSKCLPPSDVDFSIAFTEVKPIVEEKKENNVPKKEEEVMQEEEVKTKESTSESKKITDENQVELEDSSAETESIEDEDDTKTEATLYGITSIAESTEQCADVSSTIRDDESKTLMGIFILGLLGGFLALLTPCVFPLIPLTVSFFTKSAEDKKKGFRNAVLYGLFILLVYVVLSIPFHLLNTLNPDILNEISTNVWLNVGFFAVFLFFAFSFFGYYEINIPSSWTNRISSAESVGGIIGIFFMALTLSLVSFSCTGPILGSLLAGALSSDGGAWQLTAGMSGFGLALALPFALFAMFPGWMNKLPKSGGWLNTVKVVLGFVELALALKFLSNADLVMHWGVLKYELFMGLWILIGLGLALYIFGIFRFPHDSKKKKLTGARIGSGFVVAALTIYLCFGLTYNSETKTFNSLKLLSGLAPPAGYSWIYPNDCPNDINCFKDLEEGMAYAQKVNKPILLDFTGYACVNCRKMEEHVWSDPRIFDLINDDYVLVSLYVDDKEDLPEEEQIEVERVQGGTRKLRNVGHKWAHFQTKFFNTNAQPFYVAVSPDGQQMLNQPVGYTPNIGEYEEFLKCGLNAYQGL